MGSDSGIFYHIVGDVLRDRVSRALLFIASGLNVAAWIATFLAQSGESFVPLHYTIYFGIDLTGPSKKLFLLPAAGTVMLVLHTLGAASYKDETWRRAFLGLVVVIETILGLAITAVLVWATSRV